MVEFIEIKLNYKNIRREYRRIVFILKIGYDFLKNININF